jgi:hypothetical protein
MVDQFLAHHNAVWFKRSALEEQQDGDSGQQGLHAMNRGITDEVQQKTRIGHNSSGKNVNSRNDRLPSAHLQVIRVRHAREARSPTAT